MKPSNHELAIIFDRAAFRYDAVTSPYAVSRRRGFFIEYAKGDCLEVGAGTGEMSRALVRAGHHVIATDISPNMVAEIKRKLGIKVVMCDAEKLPFPDSSFDTVLGAEMIYYLDHPKKFLREAMRVLRPGGLLLLSSANNTTKFYDRLRALLRVLGFGRMYFDDKVREFITAKKLKTLLESAGFRAVEVQKVIVLPFGFLDWFNKILEHTPLKHFGIFIFVYAEKV